jgi:hypothetical protein
MFTLNCTNWSWDADLQIVHADVRLEVEDDILLDEPLCVDVGLPALLYSTSHDVEPNRWAAADEWRRMPFFCCGCGDPECRAYSFRVRHRAGGMLQLTELEERQGMESRELGGYEIDADAYKSQIREIARAFLQLVGGLEYRPYFADTVKVVKDMMEDEQISENKPLVSKMPPTP